MSERLPRQWRFYIEDMTGFLEKIIAYTEGRDFAGFVADSMVFDATVRNIELVGEAATHVPVNVRLENPQIPWRLVIATRNQLIHGYLGIDNETLWSIIQHDVPLLAAELKALLDCSE